MASCYNVLCNVPVVGIAIAGSLALAAFFFVGLAKSDAERLDWMRAVAFTSILLIALMFTTRGGF